MYTSGTEQQLGERSTDFAVITTACPSPPSAPDRLGSTADGPKEGRVQGRVEQKRLTFPAGPPITHASLVGSAWLSPLAAGEGLRVGL